MIAHRPTWQNMGQAIVTPVVGPAVVTSAPASSSGTVVPGTPVPAGLFWTAVMGAAAYAGIRTGLKDKTYVKYVGWVGGVGAGLAAVAGLTSLLAPDYARTLPIRWYY